MEISGLPAHPLIVHAAVIFVPLASMLALAYAAFPGWRWATRWPMVGGAGAALGAVLAAYFSGRNFIDDQFPDQQTSTIQLHQERAQVLLWLTIVFVVFVLLAAWGLGGTSGLVSGRGARDPHQPVIEWSLVAFLVVFAIAVLLMTVATGDAGATSVWG